MSDFYESPDGFIRAFLNHAQNSQTIKKHIRISYNLRGETLPATCTTKCVNEESHWTNRLYTGVFFKGG